MTVISHEHKFIFICPRKVAGTSIQAALSRHAGADDIMGIDFPARAFDQRTDDDDFGVVRARVGDGTGRYEKHDLPDEVREKVGEKVWNEYFKFTVVRTPWDLLVSYLYFKFGPLYYWRDVWWRGRCPLGFMLNLPRAFRLHRLRSDFRRGRRKESVEAILRERLFGSVEQIPRFYFSRGEFYADRVMRFENLQQDYDEVCKRLGFPPRFLPRLNTRQRPGSTDYRDYYTEYSREHVADLCRPLTAEFGYRFDDGSPTQRGGQEMTTPGLRPGNTLACRARRRQGAGMAGTVYLSPAGLLRATPGVARAPAPVLPPSGLRHGLLELVKGSIRDRPVRSRSREIA